MKKWIQKISIVICVVCLSFGFSIPSFAEGGMYISPSSSSVNQGDSFTVTVTFSGNDIWFALADISCDGIFTINGDSRILIEPSAGQSSVSQSVDITAVAAGTGSIYVSGYTDEDESAVYSDSCTVTVTGASSGGDTAPGRAAGAD